MPKRKRKSGKKNPNGEKKREQSKEVHTRIKRSKDGMLIPGKMTLV